jgi:hypothetical protein
MVEWTRIEGTGYPDQQADIAPPFYAQAGPEGSDGTWSWTLLVNDPDSSEQYTVASGTADGEDQAKALAEAAAHGALGAHELHDEILGQPDGPLALATNFELLRALDGHVMRFALTGGGHVRLRLYGVDELLAAQRAAAAGLPGPDPGMTREQAVRLCAPVSFSYAGGRIEAGNRETYRP